MQLSKNLTGEFLGTALLLATVVGSGILMHKLDPGNVAVTLMGIAIATGAILITLINTFGARSAQFNPVVALMSAIQGNLPWRQVPVYMAAQIAGAIAGVIVTSLMFDLPAVTFSATARGGTGVWISEALATFGLVGTIIGCSRFKPEAVPQAVAAYVAAAIMFTSSTCFANPAVSISRMFTNTLCGILPADVPAFIASELIGLALGLAVFSWLFGEDKTAGKVADSLEKEWSAIAKERELVLNSRREK